MPDAQHDAPSPQVTELIKTLQDEINEFGIRFAEIRAEKNDLQKLVNERTRQLEEREHSLWSEFFEWGFSSLCVVTMAIAICVLAWIIRDTPSGGSWTSALAGVTVTGGLVFRVKGKIVDLGAWMKSGGQQDD
ncbi:MAG: hypothetical protein O2820_25335 [Planctomycetota bacterium]|nr:hypothetical protein [Planctomycetota bacterium]